MTCAVCAAQGADRADGTDHRAYGCPLTTLACRAVFGAWGRFSGDTWPQPLACSNRASEITPLAGDMPADPQLRRVIGLGLRPQGQEDHGEAFALVRGLLLHEIDMTHNAAWHAAQDGTPTVASDLYGAVTDIYARVRAGVQAAMTGEYARMERMERRMRAAGLEFETTPQERWQTKMGDAIDDNVKQQVMSEDPWTRTQTRSLSLRRMAPRPDWAPPENLRQDTIQIYVTTSEDNSAWAVTMITGGEGRGDAAATWHADAGGPTITDGASPLFRGVTRVNGEQGIQAAVIAALAVAAQTPPGPKLVRVEEKWTKSIAGMTAAERGGHEIRANLRAAWRTAAAQGPLWLAGWRSYRGYWWGDRAAAIARQLTPQGNGQLGPGSVESYRTFPVHHEGAALRRPRHPRWAPELRWAGRPCAERLAAGC